MSLVSGGFFVMWDEIRTRPCKLKRKHFFFFPDFFFAIVSVWSLFFCCWEDEKKGRKNVDMKRGKEKKSCEIQRDGIERLDFWEFMCLSHVFSAHSVFFYNFYSNNRRKKNSEKWRKNHLRHVSSHASIQNFSTHTV